MPPSIVPGANYYHPNYENVLNARYKSVKIRERLDVKSFAENNLWPGPG